MNEEIDIIFLMDRSGSMYGSEKDTIGGFNSFIENQKRDEANAKVTTVLFDHGYEVLYKRKNLYDVEKLTTNEYYVNMAIAWFYSIAIIKDYNKAIIYLEDRKLPKFIHNKTIQKCNESYRISQQVKLYLKTLKI